LKKLRNIQKNVFEHKFFDNLQIQDAVVRRIGIIGEVVKACQFRLKINF
jgi:uncharacterized protein with HEPN domain